MANQTITKREIRIEEFLVRQRQKAARRITVWRERNKKYFRGWNSVKAIRTLRNSNGRP